MATFREGSSASCEHCDGEGLIVRCECGEQRKDHDWCRHCGELICIDRKADRIAVEMTCDDCDLAIHTPGTRLYQSALEGAGQGKIDGVN